MADSAEDGARVGIWTDYSKSQVFGAVLTLRNRDAAILLAFLATFVGLASPRAWKLTRFFLFQISIKRQTEVEINQDRLPQLHQVVLRNSDSPIGSFFELISIFANPKESQSESPLLRTWTRIFLLCVAIGHWMIFIIAGILTSRIFLGRMVCSATTPTCGIWSSTNNTIYNEIELNKTIESDNYVRNCYSHSGLFGTDCGKLYRQAIPFAVQHNTTCPFPDASTCISPGFTMDTGNTTFTTLGLNCPLCDELSFNRRSTCSVLDDAYFQIAKYTKENLTNIANDDSIYAYYFFTNTNGIPMEVYVRDNMLRQTYDLSTYNLSPFPQNRLHPRIQHNEDHHGVSIVTLAGVGIKYNLRYDDPWFDVHSGIRLDNGSVAVGLYQMSRWLNIIGCDEQYRLCSSKTLNCTPWYAIMDIKNPLTYEVLGVDLTKDADAYRKVQSTAGLVDIVMADTGIPSSVFGREASISLQASKYMRNSVHFYLEPEQWKTELKYWFSMALARLQLGVFHSIEKAPFLDDNRATNMFTNTPLMDMCGQVKYYSPNHTSMSFFGIMFTIVISGILILLSFAEALTFVLPQNMQEKYLKDWTKSENIELLRQVQCVHGALVESGEIQRRDSVSESIK
jgi:hypothetical protein